MHDVCIIGAGPAGLSAALILGRCRRDVRIFDSGRPRNAASAGLHGYLSRDGVHPMTLRELGRTELARYPTVKFSDVPVTAATRQDDTFLLGTADGRSFQSRILLLATGRDDEVPARPGFRELYGRGVYHCPFCDGWEHRDQELVAYGRGEEAFDVALELLTWSDRITLCTDGPAELDTRQRQRLFANGVGLREEAFASLNAGRSGQLESVAFEDGGVLPCQALFFVAGCPQKSSLPESLGCSFAESGGVQCDAHAATRVPGLFVAGNVRCGLHLAITAAAEGADAAVAINDRLLEMDLR